MTEDEIKKTRAFLHELANDISISIGNSGMLNKKFKKANYQISEEEFDTRISKIDKGLDDALTRINEYREWIISKI
jgi:hypothetical protein